MKKTLVILLAAAAVFFIIFVVVTQKKTEHMLQKTQARIRTRAISLQISSEKNRESDEGQLLLSANAIHDIEYSEPNYYVATSGGIYLLNANFQAAGHLTTLSGLQAVDVRQIIKSPEYLYFIYKDGRFSRFADNTYDHFQASGLVIRNGLYLKNKVFLADQDHIYQFQDDRLQEIIEHKHIKKIFGQEHLHIIDAENRVFRIGSDSQIIATPELQLVSNARESADSVFIASSRGLYSSAAKAFLFPGHYVKDCEWQNGALFALTADGEVLTGRGTVKVISERSHIFKLKMTNGRLFALSSEGIFIWENEKWRGITIPSSLPEAFITTICQNNGTLWAGTLDRGILAIRGQTLHAHFEKSAEINDSLIFNGNPCFASTLGVLAASGAKTTCIQGTENMYCNALLADQAEIYAGSTRGLLRIRSGGLELYNLFQKLSNHKIFCLEKANSGIWCGTMGGLQYFDGHEFSKNFSSLNTPIRDNWISNIKDVNGQIYISTYNGELGEISADNIEIISRQNCKFNFNNMASYKQYLFLGTFDQGIFVINLETKRSALLRKNLPSTNITDMIIDGEKLIVASDSGIYLTDLASTLNGLDI
jgi:hypothetical protein